VSGASTGCARPAKVRKSPRPRYHLSPGTRFLGICSPEGYRLRSRTGNRRRCSSAIWMKTSLGAISSVRLCAVLRRFFPQAADLVAEDHPSLADKHRRPSTHCRRPPTQLSPWRMVPSLRPSAAHKNDNGNFIFSFDASISND
jgi:hypothetical protein